MGRCEVFTQRVSQTCERRCIMAADRCSGGDPGVLVQPLRWRAVQQDSGSVSAV